MIKKCLELLEKSKESDQLIAKNNGLKLGEVKKYRLGKKEPKTEIASLLINYLESGGDMKVKMDKNPLKEIKRRNRAILYFLNNIDNQEIRENLRKAKKGIQLSQEEAMYNALNSVLKKNNISLKEVGL